MEKDQLEIPQHIAIIMDGNGRWAKRRMMPRVYGHKNGVEAIKKVTIRAHQRGIKMLTLYAFSTENWGRPEQEVNYLMNLPKEFFNSFLPQIMENNVKVEVIGDYANLPESTHGILHEVLEKTKDNTGLILNFAINYGGHQEITYAVRQIAEQIKAGTLQPDEINEDVVQAHLMTGKFGELAQVDLMIRTSGELRTSNFLPWQLAYSEFYFTDSYWPDFDGDALDEAIIEYNRRNRRFGKLDETS
ncbi:isoprenyl transferase [Suicoccus acidiformans]|uniref:Isoprenyl transferase n=1 Tax=Suicoccus acidiformans TaxID=2036206 RepID=A0A347WK59_9LACT|nr:isoprenyl transferase [Suicoccus acidiformans]AXY25466.1 isoprenyl transferase [Suicoccus acidiformans]